MPKAPSKTAAKQVTAVAVDVKQEKKVEEAFTHMMACMQPSRYACVMRQRWRDFQVHRTSTLDTTCPSCTVVRPNPTSESASTTNNNNNNNNMDTKHSPLPALSLRPVSLRPCTS